LELFHYYELTSVRFVTIVVVVVVVDDVVVDVDDRLSIPAGEATG
jgi:hypothetical protein